ncbi:MAG: adenylate/guanylate cyclase domain-containing protein, partial [Pyrinomonadaceae bacterium]|nr:adenylate/guanylate cyclase domain-containing protein [Phycisphaerales bacterium]
WIELGKLIEAAKSYNLTDASLFAEPPGRELEWLDSPGALEWLQEKDKQARRASDAAKDFVEFSADTDPATLEPDDAAFLANHKAIAAGVPLLLDQLRAGVTERQEVREKLKRILGGKLVFVGWTSTGSIADTAHTSINPKTPGVYLHAAVANAMLTGFAREFVPLWVDVLFICVFGALGTLTAIRPAVWASPLIAALLIVVWFFIAGVGLWDAAWRIASVTGPSLAVGGSWLAVTVHRLLVEQRARRRTEEQFRSYVSPEVVDILVENPRLGSVAPQRRELTVMMTDLEGFTSLAERLGEEETARVLGTYLGEMTRVLLRHGATIDKYLGDGIMAFWGAPLDDADHARHACSAALDMLATLERLNAQHIFGEAGQLRLRIGLAAGQLMVGDFGCPPYRSSYTVLGDTANLCDRLEGANKLLGTSVLVSGRVRELAERAPSPGRGGGERNRKDGGPDTDAASKNVLSGNNRFLWRPIGRVRLRGRAGAEEVFELLGSSAPGVVLSGVANDGAGTAAPRALTNPEQNVKNGEPGPSGSESVNPAGSDQRMDRRLTLTGQGVREYSAGAFESAQSTFGRLTTLYGEDPLCRRYLTSMADWQSRIRGPITPDSLPKAGFDGTIDLTDA